MEQIFETKGYVVFCVRNGNTNMETQIWKLKYENQNMEIEIWSNFGNINIFEPIIGGNQWMLGGARI